MNFVNTPLLNIFPWNTINLSPSTEWVRWTIRDWIHKIWDINNHFLQSAQKLDIDEALNLLNNTENITLNPHIVIFLLSKCETLTDVQKIPYLDKHETKDMAMRIIAILIKDRSIDAETRLYVLDKLLKKLSSFNPSKAELNNQLWKFLKNKWLSSLLKQRLKDFLKYAV